MLSGITAIFSFLSVHEGLSFLFLKKERREERRREWTRVNLIHIDKPNLDVPYVKVIEGTDAVAGHQPHLPAVGVLDVPGLEARMKAVVDGARLALEVAGDARGAPRVAHHEDELVDS